MEVTVYTFDELNEKAQAKAIEDFRSDIDYPSGKDSRDTLDACNKDCEWQQSDEYIRETIEANDYEFDEYGNMI